MNFLVNIKFDTNERCAFYASTYHRALCQMADIINCMNKYGVNPVDVRIKQITTERAMFFTKFN